MPQHPAAIAAALAAGEGGIGGEICWICPSLTGDTSDYSDNANDGTLRGSAVLVADTGAGGSQAIRIPAVINSAVVVPNGPGLTVGNSMALTGWFKTEAGQAANGYLVSHGTTINAGGYHLFHAGTASLPGNVNGSVTTNGSNNLVSQNNVVGSDWEFYALVLEDGGDVILYRNGVEVARRTPTLPVNQPNADFLIGALGNGQQINGLGDDVRRFDRAITPAEVTELYNGGLGRGYLRAVQEDFTATPPIGVSHGKGLIPDLAISGSIAITPAQGESHSKGLIPDLAISGSIAITPAQGESHSVGLVPALSISGGVTISPQIGVSHSKGSTPAVDIGGNVQITPQLGESHSRGLFPTPQIGGSIQLVPLLGESHSRGLFPALSISGGVQGVPQIGVSHSRGLFPTLQIAGSLVVVPQLGRSDTVGLVPDLQTSAVRLGSHRPVNLGGGQFYVYRTGI